MKLLIITQKYDNNDANLGAFNVWWDRLAKRNEKIFILALEKQSESTASNMEVISMGKEKGIGLFKKISGFYYGLFKTIGCVDAILVHMIPKYVILAAPVAFLFGKPIYLWYAGVAANHWQLKLAVLFCRKVFTSHIAGMRANARKRVIVGHGIDIEKFTPTEHLSKGDKFPQEITILSVGRITPSKGHDLIIRAVADLVKSGYKLRLKIIGDVIQKYHQKYLEFLKELVKDSGIDERVEFAGSVSYEKMPEYFQDAEILVNAVPYGSLDKVVLEAMAAGVIPLTSNPSFFNIFSKASAKEFIFHEENVEDLKKKLKNIIDAKFHENKLLRRELRNIVIKDYNLNDLVEKLIKEMTQ